MVAKREYTRVIKKPTFWISTLMFPLLIIVLSAISGLSAASVEQKVKDQIENAKAVLIVDPQNLIDPALTVGRFQEVASESFAQEQVIKGVADAAIVYPTDIASQPQIKIYAQSQGLFAIDAYNEQAKTLLQQSILLRLPSESLIKTYNAQFDFQTKTYKDGTEVKDEALKFVLPGIAVVIYFILISFASSYLLMSVSEEKENRMIETILSIIPSRDLVWGKIAGQLAIIITQLLVLMSLVAVPIATGFIKLPFEISQVSITPLQLLVSLAYIIAGFLIMANTMVGVGAAMPSYKEAQSFSGIFVMLSVIPIYFATLIIAEPNGLIAMIASYFPLSSAVILLFRNTLGELSLAETVFSSVVLLCYVLASFYMAFKLFELGALEYSNKVSFRQYLKRLINP